MTSPRGTAALARAGHSIEAGDADGEGQEAMRQRGWATHPDPEPNLTGGA